MVTRRVAEALLRAAARRWPVVLRDDLRREWTAELHVLAEAGQRVRMLRFAASLAASRAGAPLVDRAGWRRQVRRTAATLLLAPPACVALMAVALFATAAVHGVLELRFGWAQRLQLPLFSTLCAGLGVLLALVVARAARHGVRVGPSATAVGVGLAVAITVVPAEVALHDDARQLARILPGVLVWLAGLTLALWAAATLARRGRLRLAWTVGVLAAFVAADVAVVATVVAAIPPIDPGQPVTELPPDGVDRISAPLWLLNCWTDWSFGLPRPTDWERFLITDLVLVEPNFYLACTPYALTWAIRTARAEPAAEAATAQATA
ncbi:hypothetical protein [Micromonospora sp. U56]|uniref:hypothetical protein n=1 Tax=Micromonospora sp. U56 TaxID=2824900 RepID=UPI001FFC8582|nr:hypothetical protein [Micromonospora sp. U56]